MKKISLFATILLFLSSSVYSQESTAERSNNFKYNNNFDISLGASSGQITGALSWVHFYGFGKNKRFKIGYGLRYTGYWGSKQNYITAPALLTSGQKGPQVLFTEINPLNYDTLFVSKAQQNALNISINLQYSLSKKIDLGFNIDAVGVSFGAKQIGKYMASARPLVISETQSAKPSPFNALLISDNDIGTLNSELYASYWITPKIALKAGFSFLFTEYTTDNKLVLDNDRWRKKSLMGILGVTFSPYK